MRSRRGLRRSRTMFSGQPVGVHGSDEHLHHVRCHDDCIPRREFRNRALADGEHFRLLPLANQFVFLLRISLESDRTHDVRPIHAAGRTAFRCGCQHHRELRQQFHVHGSRRPERGGGLGGLCQ